MGVIDIILEEWSKQVGTINRQDPEHIAILSQMLMDMDMPFDDVQSAISILSEGNGGLSPEERERAHKKGLKHLGKGTWGKDVGRPTHKAQDGKLVPIGDEEKPKEKQPSEEKPKPKSKITKIKSDPFDKDKKVTTSSKEKRKKLFLKKSSTLTSNEKDTLRNEDHENTNNALNYTKSQYKIDKLKTGEKGVGAGTPESRAGEAAVHWSLRTAIDLLGKGKSMDEVNEIITKKLMGIAKDSDTYLKKDWAESAVNSMNLLVDTFGTDNLKEVVWDTKAGRHLIDTEDHRTSSDMFVTLKNGKRIGISLKKDTKVFLMNGGAPTQQKLMKQILTDANVSKETVSLFDEATNPSLHTTQLNEAMDNTISVLKSNMDIAKDIRQKYYGQSDLIIKDFDSDKYEPFVNEVDKILEKLPDVESVIQHLKQKYPDKAKQLTKQELHKFIHKLAKNDPLRSTAPDLYDNARKSDLDYTRRFSDFFKSNPEAEKGLRVTVLKGMHFEDTLFNGDNPNLDDFMTIYGKEKTTLSTNFIIETFGVKDLHQKWQNERNPKKREELKQKIIGIAEESIVIDHQEGSRQGEIRIKDKDNENSKGVHLFSFGTRSRPLGASPTLEMAQTTFMGNAIKQGSTNVGQWDEKSKNKWKNERIKNLKDNLSEATTDEKQDILNEIEYVTEL